MDVDTLADWVTIVAGTMFAATYFAATIVVIMLGLLVRSLLKRVSALLDDNVKPMFDSAKGTTDTVRGTTDFVARAAVAPVIRAYGVMAGARRAASVLTDLTGASNDKKRE